MTPAGAEELVAPLTLATARTDDGKMQQFPLFESIVELDKDETPVAHRQVRPFTCESTVALVLRYVRLN